MKFFNTAGPLYISRIWTRQKTNWFIGDMVLSGYKTGNCHWIKIRYQDTDNVI